MKTIFIPVLMSIALAGCRPSTAVADPEAAAAYRAAWVKARNGDPAGYRAGLESVAKKYPDSRAGRRAKEALRPKASSAPSGLMALGAFALQALAKTAFGPPTGK
jgi:hypothetical protein